MRRAVSTARLADADIESIILYIASDRPASARRFRIELEAAFQRIGARAESYRVVDMELPWMLRVCRVSQRFHKYLVYYRIIDNNMVEVARVLHGARDVTARIREFADTARPR